MAHQTEILNLINKFSQMDPSSHLALIIINKNLY